VDGLKLYPRGSKSRTDLENMGILLRQGFGAASEASRKFKGKEKAGPSELGMTTRSTAKQILRRCWSHLLEDDVNFKRRFKATATAPERFLMSTNLIGSFRNDGERQGLAT
jgi:hypothetical protein